jgi:hypothetical protein
MAGSIGAGFCRGFAGRISFDKHDSEHMVDELEEQIGEPLQRKSQEVIW